MNVTKRMLERRIAGLEEHNEDLQSRLDSVMEIVQPEAHDEDQEERDDRGDACQGRLCQRARARRSRVGLASRGCTELRRLEVAALGIRIERSAARVGSVGSAHRS